MNKPKQSEVKKILVRNPEQPAPKAVTVTQSKEAAKFAEDCSASLNKPSMTRPPKGKVTLQPRFNTPELYSTLKLSKKIDEVVQPRKTKSLSDVNKNKLAVDEKVSRKVNFPYGQPVFKDLIPLTNKEIKSQPVLTSRGPILPKDKEPVLSDFLEPRKAKVYYHPPHCGSKHFEDSLSLVGVIDSLNLYKILQINEEKD